MLGLLKWLLKIPRKQSRFARDGLIHYFGNVEFICPILILVKVFKVFGHVSMINLMRFVIMMYSLADCTRANVKGRSGRQYRKRCMDSQDIIQS